eukprot:TRINITY_DN10470_c0_g1_i5.p1 TRINITY_DN10470_c0_g1~~TRINITY_DN10470_c0_g1_i5.p1  ORF type:complete len:1292 (-),score=393.15 TRINITY_DN10470_c0_g1_i5:496-4065(-)
MVAELVLTENYKADSDIASEVQTARASDGGAAMIAAAIQNQVKSMTAAQEVVEPGTAVADPVDADAAEAEAKAAFGAKPAELQYEVPKQASAVDRSEAYYLYFATLDFNTVDHAVVKKGIMDGFRNLGLVEDKISQLHITLLEGSIIAEIQAPVDVMQDMKSLAVHELSVLGCLATPLPDAKEKGLAAVAAESARLEIAARAEQAMKEAQESARQAAEKAAASAVATKTAAQAQQVARGEDMASFDAKTAAAEAHRAATALVSLPPRSEVSVALISSATDDAAAQAKQAAVASVSRPARSDASVAGLSSATPGEDMASFDAKMAAAEAHRAATDSVRLPARSEVSVALISSASDDAADDAVVDEAMSTLLRMQRQAATEEFSAAAADKASLEVKEVAETQIAAEAARLALETQPSIGQKAPSEISATVHSSADAAEDTMALESDSAAGQAQQAAIASTGKHAPSEVSLTLGSSATGDAADEMVDEAMSKLLRMQIQATAEDHTPAESEQASAEAQETAAADGADDASKAPETVPSASASVEAQISAAQCQQTPDADTPALEAQSAAVAERVTGDTRTAVVPSKASSEVSAGRFSYATDDVADDMVADRAVSALLGAGQLKDDATHISEPTDFEHTQLGHDLTNLNLGNATREASVAGPLTPASIGDQSHVFGGFSYVADMAEQAVKTAEQGARANIAAEVDAAKAAEEAAYAAEAAERDVRRAAEAATAAQAAVDQIVAKAAKEAVAVKAAEEAAMVTRAAAEKAIKAAEEEARKAAVAADALKAAKEEAASQESKETAHVADEAMGHPDSVVRTEPKTTTPVATELPATGATVTGQCVSSQGAVPVNGPVADAATAARAAEVAAVTAEARAAKDVAVAEAARQDAERAAALAVTAKVEEKEAAAKAAREAAAAQRAQEAAFAAKAAAEAAANAVQEGAGASSDTTHAAGTAGDKADTKGSIAADIPDMSPSPRPAPTDIIIGSDVSDPMHISNLLLDRTSQVGSLVTDLGGISAAAALARDSMDRVVGQLVPPQPSKSSASCSSHSNEAEGTAAGAFARKLLESAVRTAEAAEEALAAAADEAATAQQDAQRTSELAAAAEAVLEEAAAKAAREAVVAKAAEHAAIVARSAAAAAAEDAAAAPAAPAPAAPPAATPAATAAAAAAPAAPAAGLRRGEPQVILGSQLCL